MMFSSLLGKFHLVRCLLLAASLLLLSSCNKLRLGYEYADWLVIYSVEDNFDLDKVQRNQFKEDVASYFKWHRKAMLPAYADFLSATHDSIINGLHAKEVDSAYARFKVLQQATFVPVVERATTLLMALNVDQVETWYDKQKKKNQKLRLEFSGTPEERLQHRYVKIIEELEDWTGRLTLDQKTRIKTLNATLPWNGNLWLDMREKAQERLADLLRKRSTSNEIKAFLEDYYQHPENLRTPEYQQRITDFEIKMRGVILAVSKILTPDQKRRCLNQIATLAADFRKLSLHD